MWKFYRTNLESRLKNNRKLKIEKEKKNRYLLSSQNLKKRQKKSIRK